MFVNFCKIKVIFNNFHTRLMSSDSYQSIKNLEDEILRLEDNIAEFSRLSYDEGIKKAITQLQSNLKYLSILANGAPVDVIEDKKIMNFIRTHYSYLQKLSAKV